MALLYTEPTQFYAGDTLQWTKALGDYSASDWTLHYSLKNADYAYSFDASASGSEFSVTVGTSVTSGWMPGKYSLCGYVTNDTERHVVVTGQVIILPNLAGTDPYDGRSHNRKVYESICAVIEGRGDVNEYVTVGGRSLKKIPIKELLYWQQVYAHRVMEEEGTRPKFLGATFE